MTTIEQLQVIQNENPEGASFLALIHQTGIDKAKDWYDTVKNTDADALATSYKNKYGQTIAKVVNADNPTLRSLKQVFVAIWSDLGVTLAQVQAADNSLWEQYTTQYLEIAIEYVAGINNLEKAAYNAL